jgi:hypothetical protein
MEEAIEWFKRAPFGGGVEIEIRPVFEDCDGRRIESVTLASQFREAKTQDGRARILCAKSLHIYGSTKSQQRRPGFIHP